MSDGVLDPRNIKDMHKIMSHELSLLMDMVSAAQVPINFVYVSDKRDVPFVALIHNGEGWEVCSDAEGLFDLWHKGSLHTPDMDLATAVGVLSQIYITAKVRRVLARQAAEASAL